MKSGAAGQRRPAPENDKDITAMNKEKLHLCDEALAGIAGGTLSLEEFVEMFKEHRPKVFGGDLPVHDSGHPAGPAPSFGFAR